MRKDNAASDLKTSFADRSVVGALARHRPSTDVRASSLPGLGGQQSEFGSQTLEPTQ